MFCIYMGYQIMNSLYNDYVEHIFREHGEDYIADIVKMYYEDEPCMALVYHFQDGIDLIKLFRKSIPMEMIITDIGSGRVIGHLITDITEIICYTSNDRNTVYKFYKETGV